MTSNCLGMEKLIVHIETNIKKLSIVFSEKTLKVWVFQKLSGPLGQKMLADGKRNTWLQHKGVQSSHRGVSLQLHAKARQPQADVHLQRGLGEVTQQQLHPQLGSRPLVVVEGEAVRRLQQWRGLHGVVLGLGFGTKQPYYQQGYVAQIFQNGKRSVQVLSPKEYFEEGNSRNTQQSGNTQITH